MPAPIPGIHHVTAIASDPGRNLAFYTETLGLRLVKRSINQDDVSVYHLFYADYDGTPGTSMTFFPYVDSRQGRVGTGQVSTVAFTIPAASVDYWVDRFDEAGVEFDDPRERFGDTVIPFRDPDGLPLELVATDDAPPGNQPTGPVPEDHVVRGFFGVTLSLQSGEPTANLLKTMGYRETDGERDRTRFEAGGDPASNANGTSSDESAGGLGAVVDVLEDPQAPRGQPGAGTVHHVAFRVTDAEQAEWRDALQEQGLRPTEIIDRKWFRSVYVREHGGVLFEFATKEPGYTVDEPLDELGERLVLPEWLEDRRAEIEAGLPDLPGDVGASSEASESH